MKLLALPRLSFPLLINRAVLASNSPIPRDSLCPSCRAFLSLLLIFISMHSVFTTESKIPFSPSSCNKGYVQDFRSPLLMGKGFGPKPYQELFEIWLKTSRKVLGDYNINQVAQGRLLVSRMHEIQQENCQEEVLSGLITGSLHTLMPLLSNCDVSSLCALHQVYAPGKSNTRADICLVDFKHANPTVHSILEIKWVSETDSFPEAQACASAALFHETLFCPYSWIPTFVLTKSSYRIGVAFWAFERRWAFSEIFDHSNAFPFDSGNSMDVLLMLHFSDFLVQSAVFHRSCAVTDLQSLVDSEGRAFLDGCTVIGDRVLMGFQSAVGSLKVRRKIVKFFANREIAARAIARQSEISKILRGEHLSNQELIEGCGSNNKDQVCAVLDDYFEATRSIAYDHLIKLTEIVSVLDSKGMVHGDLRIPNILMLKNGDVRLIDFEWSAKKGVAKFPSNANSNAFGPLGKRHVIRNQKIPENFDWLCLADIFSMLGCLDSADFALHRNKHEVISALNASRIRGDAIQKLPRQGIPNLNLQALGGRLRAYYSKSIVPSKERPAKRRRRDTGSALGAAEAAQAGTHGTWRS